MHDDSESISNPSATPRLEDLIATPLSRRSVLKGGLAALVATLPFSVGASAARASAPRLGFSSIPVSSDDAVHVAPGYRVSVLYRWGDETGIVGAPRAPFRPDASNSAAEQALQAGMHHDGMHFFPLPAGSNASDHGLLVINHEYTDDGLLHADGMRRWSHEKVLKSQHAHGLSVIEVRRSGGDWAMVRPSPYARRITARTPIAVSGPAAGDARLRTQADPGGREVLGTLNNCAMGWTPWGTYLACEENFHEYFHHGGRPTAAEKRYGIRPFGLGYRWHEHDARFDAALHPNEPNRFGWVVEVDPYDPAAKPVKRTALGRFKHESATVSLAPDGRVAVYSGDDERFEYIYKFVSRGRFDPHAPEANRRLLDEGTLYVARFEPSGSGRWLALVHGRNGLDASRGLASQADILVHARAAADRVGATPMDRPEWIAVHPRTREVYVTLTNNSRRGRPGFPAADAANPRAPNVYGHILRWREQDGDPAAEAFDWSVFLLAGDPAHPEVAHRGTAGPAFGGPDGLHVDGRGLLWIMTDVSASRMGREAFANLGANQLLAADPASGELRRFLVGPVNCEITGLAQTPDGRTFFLNIQHPGEAPDARADPAWPDQYSRWPDGHAGARPRSATIVIRREDGGVIGR
ncbi:MAG: PhoX family phosphatase [Burkholderiales bacterium]|nr:PhoX family phosphatase [Burkholderiales bacterium]